jgi:uncharacterized protein YjbJ (UPF0337 family)
LCRCAFAPLKPVNFATNLNSCVTLLAVKVLNFVSGICYLDLISNNMTNATELKGNWNEQKGKLKQKFAILTDNDLMFAAGKQEEMLGRIQLTLGKTKEQLRAIIAAL